MKFGRKLNNSQTMRIMSEYIVNDVLNEARGKTYVLNFDDQIDESGSEIRIENYLCIKAWFGKTKNTQKTKIMDFIST